MGILWLLTINTMLNIQIVNGVYIGYHDYPDSVDGSREALPT